MSDLRMPKYLRDLESLAQFKDPGATENQTSHRFSLVNPTSGKITPLEATSKSDTLPNPRQT